AVRGAIRSFLEIRTRYKVCGEAGDGIAAIEKARAASCDLILLDLAMPNLSGVEAAPVLRSMLPQTKIVGFSILAEEFGAEELAAVGFDVVLSKRDGLAKLAETLRSLLPADTTAGG